LEVKEMDNGKNLVLIGAAAYLASSLVPAFKGKAWWVRVWDFPRLQFSLAGAGLLFYASRSLKQGSTEKRAVVSLLGAGLALDAYRILPYSPLVKLESLPAEKNDPAQMLSMLTCNVYQFNKQRRALLDLIRRTMPDIVFLLEVDKPWVDDCQELKETHPHTLLNPLSNTYGLAFYSKLPLTDAMINFLIEDDVPSIETTLTLRSGQKVKLFGLHPRPPRPQDGPSTKRDAELIQIAIKSKETDLPTVVIGDLNDVAWSHTTRHFRRISGLLDPRIGRGPTPTFPVWPPFMRFPIDHIFHSRSLRIAEMRRLDDVGSDHFPLFARLSFEPETRNEQDAPSPIPGDIEEAHETLAEAKD
jgi:endonuclease/exonuclease/phosphatase (EEP) superfamily protein YafD